MLAKVYCDLSILIWYLKHKDIGNYNNIMGYTNLFIANILTVSFFVH